MSASRASTSRHQTRNPGRAKVVRPWVAEAAEQGVTLLVAGEVRALMCLGVGAALLGPEMVEPVRGDLRGTCQ